MKKIAKKVELGEELEEEMRKLLNKLKWQIISLDEGGVNLIVEDLEKERENINISDIWWMIPTLELDEESEGKLFSWVEEKLKVREDIVNVD